MIARLRDRLADRNRLPRPINAAIDWVAAHPMSIPGRLAALRYGRPQSGTPVTAFAPAERRVLIAPVNYSGQGRAWAAALEATNPSISARNMAVEVPGGFAFAADLIVPVAVYQNDRDWQRRQFEAVATSATHVLVEAQEPPFGRLWGRRTDTQVAALVARGVDVAFMAHGTDVRLPSRHIARSRWSHYADPSVYVPRLEQLARHNRALLDRAGRPVFVSTPDLLADVSEAQWCPVVVDPQRWANPSQVGARAAGPLRVAHAPSVASTKGTALIAPVLSKLEALGVIEYRQITGIPSAQMPEVYWNADVVLDQFRVGSYGVGACEAMAAGCVVVGHVMDDVRDIVGDTTGQRLPVVEATPDTLEAVLRALAEDGESLRNSRSAGIGFVRQVHDGRLSSSVLTKTWLH